MIWVNHNAACLPEKAQMTISWSFVWYEPMMYHTRGEYTNHCNTGTVYRTSTQIYILCYYFDINYISVWTIYFISSDHDEFFRNTKQVLDELGLEGYSSEDCKIVKYVCTLISARAAFLSAAGETFQIKLQNNNYN